MTVDAYVFLYWSRSMTSQVETALDIVRGYPVTRLWLDIENGPDGRTEAQLTALIQEAINACGTFPRGLYTGKWWWSDHMNNSAAFSDELLWYARYDGNPDLSTWETQNFGGWTAPVGKQYRGNQYLSGIIVDFNTMYITAPTPSDYDAVCVDASYPSTMTAGDTAVVWVEYRNTGYLSWNTADTRLGTQSPQDRHSAFHTSYNWIRTARPTPVDADTAREQVGRFTFILTAPRAPAQSQLQV